MCATLSGGMRGGVAREYALQSAAWAAVVRGARTAALSYRMESRLRIPLTWKSVVVPQRLRFSESGSGRSFTVPPPSRPLLLHPPTRSPTLAFLIPPAASANSLHVYSFFNGPAPPLQDTVQAYEGPILPFCCAPLSKPSLSYESRARRASLLSSWECSVSLKGDGRERAFMGQTHCAHCIFLQVYCVGGNVGRVTNHVTIHVPPLCAQR